MKIKTQNYNDVTVIEIEGELVAEYMKAFEDTGKSVIEEGAAGIVMDMSRVERPLSLREERVSIADSRSLNQEEFVSTYSILIFKE